MVSGRGLADTGGIKHYHTLAHTLASLTLDDFPYPPTFPSSTAFPHTPGEVEVSVRFELFSFLFSLPPAAPAAAAACSSSSSSRYFT